MAKARFSISIDADLAAQVRRHAENAGVDVSTYFADAASHQIATIEENDARFEHIDALIEAAESALPGVPQLPDVELTDEERQEVRAALDLVYGVAENRAA